MPERHVKCIDDEQRVYNQSYLATTFSGYTRCATSMHFWARASRSDAGDDFIFNYYLIQAIWFCVQITHICQYTYTANLKRTIVLPTQRHGSSISSHNNHCIYGSDRIAHSSNIYDATHSPNISFITSYNTYSCTHFTRYICATIRSLCVYLPRIRRGHHHPHSQCGTFRLFGPKFRHIYVVRFCLWCTIESKSKTHPCTDSQTLYLRSDAIFFPRSVSSFAGAWSLGSDDWNRNYTQPINTHLGTHPIVLHSIYRMRRHSHIHL